MADSVEAGDVPKNGDVPRGSVQRTAKLAGLPLGYFGRTALGFGKRIGGISAEIVGQEIQQRTADQVFRVLGELKGGAMKFGQALSIFEAALPPEIAEPYRATLTKLQESAPPLPASTVPICTPRMVTTGSSALRSTWEIVTLVRLSPLARAVRTKSSCATSSIEERMTRA